MNENTVNVKPLQIVNPNTGRKIFVGTKTYKDLQNQGLIPKDTAFNSKKLAKAEPLFKVMNKTSSGGGAEPKSSTQPTHKTGSKTKPTGSKTKHKQDKVDYSESESDDLDKILSKAFGSEAQAFQTKTKMKQLPPTPSSESESESESESASESDSDSDSSN